jgi:preprotein translocase subunit SecG
MFGFSAADWIFIGFILVVIYVCVIVSALIQKKKGSDS